MINVIGLCGYATAGKDEAARGLEPFGFQRVSFADPVRAAALAIDPIVAYNVDHIPVSPVRLSDLVLAYGWEATKRNPEARRALQKLGTEGGREIHGPDCWTRIGGSTAREILAAGNRVAFTDCRFPNEVDLVRELGGIMVRVDRPGVGPVNSHVSDNLEIRHDALVVNDGTVEQLHARIREVVANQASN